MTSTREGTTQSTKMPRGFCRVANERGREKKGERMRGNSRRIEEETTRDISFRFRNERERDSLTDGVETRCYVAFRNLVALELPPFLLFPLCVSASLFSPRLPRCLSFYFWSRFTSSTEETRSEMRTTSSSTHFDLPRTFSFRDGGIYF